MSSEKPKKPPTLYDVPITAIVEKCSLPECGRRIYFAASRLTPGKFVPVSLDHELAEKNPEGRTIRAPSHFTDCADPSGFSRRGRR